MNQPAHDNMDEFLSILPGCIRQPLSDYDLKDLVEVVLDIGRPPEARFFDRAVDLSDKVVTQELLNMVTAQLSFGGDNRAGISGTLHRISAIRDRCGSVIGLTCRVGRAIYGAADVIDDLLQSGKSVLVLGRPGLGKTTRLRDAARLLSTEHRKRVIIVDTSNEIAGDGIVPHEAIGRARRMPVPNPAQQSSIMVEAVENHTPEIIVIDEIGDFKDVAAARTIAERGVQLIATAHGFTIANIIDNPALSDLLGGIQVVTLGDDEAKRRGTRKTVVERKHVPTFDVVIEIIDFDTLGVYTDAAEAVDCYLTGCAMERELRSIRDGKVHIELEVPDDAVPNYDKYTPNPEEVQEKDEADTSANLLVYALGLSRANITDVLDELGVKATIVNKPEKANLILVVAARESSVAKHKGKAPVFVVKSNSKNQVRNTLHQVFSD